MKNMTFYTMVAKHRHCARCSINLTVAVTLVLVFGLASPSPAQTYNKSITLDANITIRNLQTTEQQLLHDYNRATGLRQGEIEKELKAVREQIVQEQERLHQQKMEELRLNAESAKELAEIKNRGPSASSKTYNSSPPSQPPPTVDWRTVETSKVVVKGIFKQGDRYGALVSGGQYVYSNDVFATTYDGKQQYWRVTFVDRTDAKFEPVQKNGEPSPSTEPIMPSAPTTKSPTNVSLPATPAPTASAAP